MKTGQSLISYILNTKILCSVLPTEYWATRRGVVEAELDTDGEEYYFAFDKKPEAYTG